MYIRLFGRQAGYQLYYIPNEVNKWAGLQRLVIEELVSNGTGNRRNGSSSYRERERGEREEENKMGVG